jgi:hypothetical protein
MDNARILPALSRRGGREADGAVGGVRTTSSFRRLQVRLSQPHREVAAVVGGCWPSLLVHRFFRIGKKAALCMTAVITEFNAINPWG